MNVDASARTGSLSVLSTPASGRQVCGKTTDRRCSTLSLSAPLPLSGKTRYRLPINGLRVRTTPNVPNTQLHQPLTRNYCSKYILP